MSNPKLTEAHVLGRATRQWIVRAEDCPELARHHIKHAAVLDVAAPFRMVRLDPDGSFLLFCFRGEGRILVEGNWRAFRAGMAGLAPPHVLDAFRALPRSRWGICWVRYREPHYQKPIVNASSPVIAHLDPEPIRAAIWGLYRETRDAADPVAKRHWAELIHGYATRIALPWRADDRLWRLWPQVTEKLSEHWTLNKLAALSHLSEEHLRRLCRQQLGRSPMHQLTYLRIERAAEMLENTSDKVESIANAVGYQNPFTFSNTFKKWTGLRPSDYRNRRRTLAAKR